MWSLSQIKNGKVAPIIFVVFLALPSVASLLTPGFFLSDDGEWMVIRFSAFHQALADGQLPIRWLGRLNHEYGYPVANFLYPGFMYFAEPIHLLGFGFVDAIKIVLGLSMVGSALFCYLWLTKFFDRWAASLGALFYLYIPYHLYDLYKRGSVGEVLAIAVLPFILWMVERRSFLFVSLGIAMLILSHNTLAALFLPVVLVYVYIRKVSSIKYQVLSILFGLATSAFFWIPALFDLQYTRFFQTTVSNWRDHFANLTVIGWLALLLLAGTVMMRQKKREVLFFFILGATGVFLSLPISSFIWQAIPASFVQFPFRFLSLLLPSVAYLSARIISELKGQVKFLVYVVLLIFLILSSLPFLRPVLFFDKGDSYYATNEDTTNVQNEYMPKWVNVMPQDRTTKKVEVLGSRGVISDVIQKSNNVTFKAAMENDGIIRIYTVYFPGWKAFLDGKETNIVSSNERGLMEITVPAGKHTIAIAFGETPIRLVGDIISIGTLFGLLFWRKRLSI